MNTPNGVWIRPRTEGEIATLCLQRHIPYRTLSGRLERVLVGTWPYQVHYLPHSGAFWGVAPDGIYFHSTNALHDHEAWMQALRGFFHVHAPAPSRSCLPEDIERAWQHAEAVRRGQMELRL